MIQLLEDNQVCQNIRRTFDQKKSILFRCPMDNLLR